MRNGLITGAAGVALLLSGAALAQQDGAAEAREVQDEVVTIGKQVPYIRLSETATKTNQDLINTPLSVTILNATFLDDLRAETLSDAYPYTLGLSQTGNLANSFTLRGLPSDLQNVQVNGLPGLATRFGSPTTANVERVEVLKGPASVLYGLMEPGGLINVITKKPQTEAAYSFSVTGQSHAGNTSGFGEDLGTTLTFDATGALTNDKRWSYRFIASYEYLESFRDGVAYENIYLFPSLTYRFSEKASATIGLEYINEKGDADDGLAAVNNDINLTEAINVRYQEDGDFDNDEGFVIFASLDYELSPGTVWRVNYRSVFHEDERKLFENNRVNDADDPLDATLRRRDRQQLNKRDYHFLDTNIIHSFSTGSIEHTLLVGFNGGFERSDFERIRFGSNVTPNISIFDPELGVGMPVAITSGTDRITDRWNYGFYAQNVMDIGRFSLMIGGRYDRQDVDFIEQVGGNTEDQTTEAFLPQGGIVFRASDSISVYASYTESFSPNSVERRTATGGTFDPEEGEQYEVGLKAELFDGLANLTLAGFHIEKTNILERDANGDFMLLGSLESEGFEIELQALPLPHWQIRVGYAYVDSVVSESPNAALIGARNAFAPEHDFFIWTRYNYPQEIWGGQLGASLGINYESVRFTNANPASQVALPSYVRVDLGLYYDIEDFSIALNVENLFDETYYTGGTTDRRIFPGEPRLITLTVRKQF